MAHSEPASRTLQSLGFLEPFQVLEPSACDDVLRRLRGDVEPHTWFKGHAASNRAHFDIGTHPAIVEVLQDVLGDDLMLWGSVLVDRAPAQRHAWHADAEAHLAGGRTINVWLGLENTGPRSSLTLVPGSHAFETSPQEHAARRQQTRDAASDDEVLSWAQQHDPAASEHVTDVPVGAALVFDGRLWHASRNHTRARRTALLLQYARPSSAVVAPAGHEWPFEARTEPRPPCVMVKGTPDPDANRFVTAPAPGGEIVDEAPGDGVHPLPAPIPGSPGDPWRRHHVRSGPSTAAATFGIHASTLEPGHTPHEPHEHAEEELLVVLDGTGHLTVANGTGLQEVPVRPGAVAYYPASHAHTITAGDDGPITYVMLRWWSGDAGNAAPLLEHAVIDAVAAAAELPEGDDAPGFVTARVFEGPTSYLHKLHCHVSRVLPGGGYAPHVDPYDIAIIVLDGEVVVGDSVAGRGDLVVASAGRAHGLRNDGDVAARYLVFEFHPAHQERPRASLARRIGRRLLPVWAKDRLKGLLPIGDFPG